MKPRRRESETAAAWRQFRRNRRALASLVLVAALGWIALFADFIANDKPYVATVGGRRVFPILIDYGVKLGIASWPEDLRGVDWRRLDRSAGLWPPIPYSPGVDLEEESFAPPSRRHWLGTDQLGRDVASGMVHGTRISLTIGLVVVAIQLVIGVVLGGLAGYYGGWVDTALSRFFELMLAIPTFFLILTVAAVLPPSIYTVMAILGLTGWVGIARFVRSEFLRLRAQDFVVAARALGVSHLAIMFRHILPNALAPVFVSASFGVASAILAESALSFLGVGVPPELVTWGSILAVSRSNTFAWWLAVFPGAAIFVTVTAYNLLGDGLRDALDPRIARGASSPR
jgi:peptide/nickel transport system permease protein